MSDARVKKEKAVRETKNNLILDAALKVFSNRGFHDTRLEDIASAAGFSKASLYNYYEDKEDIFLSLAIREYVRLSEILKGIIEATGSFEERLRRLVGAIFKVFGDHFAIFLTISNFRTVNILNLERLSEQHEKRASMFKSLHDKISDLLISLIASGRKSGEIYCSVDDTVLARYIGALLRSVLIEWKIAGRMGNSQEEIEQMILFMKNGLGIKEK
jgi:AcrR family transcriptional regulator